MALQNCSRRTVDDLPIQCSCFLVLAGVALALFIDLAGVMASHYSAAIYSVSLEDGNHGRNLTLESR